MNADDERAWIAAGLFVWGVIGGAILAWLHGATRKRPPWEPLPPGYGERYHYRSMFDSDDTMAEGPEQPDDDMVRPMPGDQHDEPTNVIEAYQRFTACRVCGFKARICSSEACPQRRYLA